MKKFKEVMMHIIAVFVVIGLFSDVYLLSTKPIPEMNEKVLYMILGVLGASFTQVINWYFGSSSGSKDKTEILSNK